MNFLIAEDEIIQAYVSETSDVSVPISDGDLIKIVGYITAQSGGVPSLKLDKSELDSLVEGLYRELSGGFSVMESPQEEIEVAISEAQARVQALNENALEIPIISEDSLEKIGAIIVVQSGLEQLGFGVEEADLIRRGFIMGAIAKKPDPAIEEKMPAFQEFIKERVQLAQSVMQADLQRAQETALLEFENIANQWRGRDNFNVVLETTQGNVIIELMPSIAPLAVANFVGHIESNYYNNLLFHRIIKDFMIQGGDPLGTGAGGESIWKKSFPDEFSDDIRFDSVGLIAMANSGPMTNGSQFFITTSKPEWLNNKHTIFGKVVDGYEVVKKIESVETGPQNKPVEEQKILKAYLAE